MGTAAAIDNKGGTVMNTCSSTMEHRWGTRIDIDLLAEIWTDDGCSGTAWIRNASLSGAYVETTIPLPLLDCVSIRLFPTDAWLEACVVRKDETGVGLEWLHPGTAPVTTLTLARQQVAPADAAVVVSELSTVPAQPRSNSSSTSGATGLVRW